MWLMASSILAMGLFHVRGGVLGFGCNVCFRHGWFVAAALICKILWYTGELLILFIVAYTVCVRRMSIGSVFSSTSRTAPVVDLKAPLSVSNMCFWNFLRLAICLL